MNSTSVKHAGVVMYPNSCSKKETDTMNTVGVWFHKEFSNELTTDQCEKLRAELEDKFKGEIEIYNGNDGRPVIRCFVVADNVRTLRNVAIKLQKIVTDVLDVDVMLQKCDPKQIGILMQ